MLKDETLIGTQCVIFNFDPNGIAVCCKPAERFDEQVDCHNHFRVSDQILKTNCREALTFLTNILHNMERLQIC